ncbi:MAG TPA: SpoIID/LytB domain-containing protein [Firmicutes bacterium]|jgi:stage II sporulation protein D|nr:SpoIID/LytB domain-containing protein [Bacillota bacterium]
MPQPKKARGSCLILLGLLTLIPLLTGCPDGEGNVAKKLAQEPEISVYFHETKERKTMSIEEYLLGVVAGEMRPDWPVEAYAAQAIVARTFTMDFIADGGTKEEHDTDISTDEEEAQAYNAAAITPAIRKAVAMTKGQVITYRGRYVKGWFSASCGGKTALARDGLAYKEKEPAYMRSVSCPEAEVIPESELFWSHKFSPQELAAALSELGQEIGPVNRIAVASRSKESHRATKLKFTGTNGEATVPGADFRIAADPQKMRSIWLTDIKHEGDGITLEGRGFGHGVGLCQWGAHALAKGGKSPEEIIKHYYPKAKVTKLW